MCTNLDNKKLKISFRVTYVDVSQPPLFAQSVIPRPQVTLPGDFFFPLSNDVSSPLQKRQSLQFLFVFLICLIQF